MDAHGAMGMTQWAKTPAAQAVEQYGHGGVLLYSHRFYTKKGGGDRRVTVQLKSQAA